jgi:predicted MFS family arabinose efflux permease
MGIFQAGLLVPVAIGPVIGGALSGSLGWRSIFWFLAIYSGVFLLILVLLLPETLRSIVANGGHSHSSPVVRYPLILYQKTTTIEWNSTIAPSQPKERKHVDITGPFRILFNKQAATIIAYLAVYYAVWQMSITAVSTLFETRYHLKETEIGLTFIANGVGSMIGTVTTGKILDIEYRHVKSRHEPQANRSDVEASTSGFKDDFPLEKARLRLMPLFALIQCVSIIPFGWSIHYSRHVHIAVPIVSTFITGWTAVSTQSMIMTYLVDTFHDRSAAASASLNLARCLLAAGGTSFIMPMINGIGSGPAFTVCVGAQIVALLAVVVHLKFVSRRGEKD